MFAHLHEQLRRQLGQVIVTEAEVVQPRPGRPPAEGGEHGLLLGGGEVADHDLEAGEASHRPAQGAGLHVAQRDVPQGQLLQAGGGGAHGRQEGGHVGRPDQGAVVQGQALQAVEGRYHGLHVRLGQVLVDEVEAADDLGVEDLGHEQVDLLHGEPGLPQLDAPHPGQAAHQLAGLDLAKPVREVVLLGGGGVDQGHEDGELGEAGHPAQLGEHQVQLVLGGGGEIVY